MRMLRDGATLADGQALRAEIRDVAQWVLDFAAPCYGPGGGFKALAGDETVTTASAASALRELPQDHPGLDPYRRLAERVQAVCGDGATTALLLAAGMVRRLTDVAGLGTAAATDALALARRQVLVGMDAAARAAQPEELLVHVVPEQPAWPAEVVAGIQAAHAAGLRRLDDVHILVRDGGPVWSAGLHLEAAGPRSIQGVVRVLLLEAGPRKVTATSRDPAGMRDAEAAALRRWVTEVAARADLVVCRKRLEDRKEALASKVLVLDAAPADLWRRLQAATGARPGLHVADAEVGHATLRRNPSRIGGQSLHGQGPSATMRVPAGVRVWKDDAERLLRAVPCVLDDPRGIPGGGAWQRDAAAGLVRASSAAPGKTPLGVTAIAKAFADLADHLVRNTGQDPTRKPLLDTGPDAYACVRPAVAAAFETARLVLRVDGRYAKRASAPADLRGGMGPAGSPSGMPGDIPPLM